MDVKIGKVGSADVAKLAGVSRSAVSRTFTEGTYVSPETRAKVLEAARALGYRPNVLARSLTTNRTNIIGILTTHLDNPFYATLLQEVIERIQSKGLATLVLTAGEGDNDDLVARLLSYQVDGIIVTSANLSAQMAQNCVNAGKPVIILNRHPEIDEVTAVTCDNASCGAQVADLLMDLGRERIAFIGGNAGIQSSIEREEGFRKRLSEYGVALHGSADGHYTHAGGLEAARQLLSAPMKPDAIFAANDLMAFASLDVIRREFGLRVPEDIAVVGFDNSAAAEWPAHRLTSVDQNAPRMVDVAVDEITARLSGEKARTRQYNIVGRLVLRASTGNPAG